MQTTNFKNLILLSFFVLSSVLVLDYLDFFRLISFDSVEKTNLFNAFIRKINAESSMDILKSMFVLSVFLFSLFSEHASNSKHGYIALIPLPFLIIALFKFYFFIYWVDFYLYPILLAMLVVDTFLCAAYIGNFIDISSKKTFRRF